MRRVYFASAASGYGMPQDGQPSFHEKSKQTKLPSLLLYPVTIQPTMSHDCKLRPSFPNLNPQHAPPCKRHVEHVFVGYLCWRASRQTQESGSRAYHTLPHRGVQRRLDSLRASAKRAISSLPRHVSVWAQVACALVVRPTRSVAAAGVGAVGRGRAHENSDKHCYRQSRKHLLDDCLLCFLLSTAVSLFLLALAVSFSSLSRNLANSQKRSVD